MNTIKKHVKAIIFDMDGTILKSEGLWQNATRRFLATHNIVQLTQKDHDIIASLSGIGLTESAETIKRAYNLDEPIVDIVKKKQQFAIDGIAESPIDFIEGFEGFHALLVKNNMPMCIATNADEASLEKFIEKKNLDSLFGKHIYHRGHVNDKAKPDPALFLYAAEQLGVKPEECIVFEDSQFGFAAAQAAGMRCIAIKSKTNQDKLHMVNESVASFTEALQALRRLVHPTQLPIHTPETGNTHEQRNT